MRIVPCIVFATMLMSGFALAADREPRVEREIRIESSVPRVLSWFGAPVVAVGREFALVAWVDVREAEEPMEIRAARIRLSDGRLMDPEGFLICRSLRTLPSYRNPMIATDGDGFLVAWTDGVWPEDADRSNVRVVVVDPKNPVESCGVAIAAKPEYETLQNVAWNGEAYVVFWSASPSPDDRLMRAVAIAADGTIARAEVTLFDAGDGTSIESALRRGSDLTLVTWSDAWGLRTVTKELTATWNGFIADQDSPVSATADENGTILISVGENTYRTTILRPDETIERPFARNPVAAVPTRDGFVVTLHGPVEELAHLDHDGNVVARSVLRAGPNAVSLHPWTNGRMLHVSRAERVTLRVVSFGDGIADESDNCPSVYNPGQQDIDGDGVGDPCEDRDGDGVADSIDTCPDFAGSYFDRDDDDLGPQCDPDDDGDGVLDEVDLCPYRWDPDQDDFDCDGLPNATDLCPHRASPGNHDGDGDGAGNECDNCPTIPNADQADADGDAIGDACDSSTECDPPTESWTIPDGADEYGYEPRSPESGPTCAVGRSPRSSCGYLTAAFVLLWLRRRSGLLPR